MAINGAHLVVNPADLTDAKIIPATFSDASELAPGRCLLKIDSWSMTSNNVTYGRASGQLGYWEFFPVDDPVYGRIPVWGFADVIASTTPEVEAGRRVYGFLPMSTHLEIEPGQITGRAMTDVVAHRANKSPIYNQYSFCDADPIYRPEHEGLLSLFRPLYTTSFLLDDFFRANDFFGAGAVVITSASSKTSLGLAHALRAGGTGDVQVIGLTGTGNVGFVEGLGLYDQVLSYDALDQITADSLAYVDMAGNGDVRRSLHTRYGDELKHGCLVGGTHWTGRDRDVKDLPGPKPVFFFAPSYAQQRIGELGGAEFQTRLGNAWVSFIGDAKGWVDVTEQRGAEAALAVYLETVAGQVSPRMGNILALSG